MAFADADVPLTQAIIADGGRQFDVEDMLDASKKTFSPTQELGWTLVAMTHYLGTDKSWLTASGDTFSVSDVLALAAKRNINRETEGGPHHLYGMAYALKSHTGTGGKLVAAWKMGRDYLDHHIKLAKKYQRPDGSFSARMFRDSRQADSSRQLVWATGHMLEWLSLALTPAQLQEDWITRAVARMVKEINTAELSTLSDGGMYHAAHALRRYRDAVSNKQMIINQ
jgi:hypothetical protein